MNMVGKFASRLKFSVVAIFALAATGLISVPATPRASASGGLAESRALYNAHCASCHGRDGHSNTPKGRETEADDISGGVNAAKTIRVVTNGKGDMPSFKRSLTKAQIASIGAYVSRL